MARFPFKSNGFTLIEMITVIVLLGVVSIGIGSFVKFGSQIYVDATNRDEIIASARFSVERLNRELRLALPNSISAYASGASQCLAFYPIVTSAIYQDIPVAPEPASNQLSFAYDGNSTFPVITSTMQVVVYPLFSNNLAGRIYPIANNPSHVGGNIWNMTLQSSVTFAEDSPTNRLYVVEQLVEYCIASNGELFRKQGSNSALMANNLTLSNTSTPFTVNNAALHRNASVLIKLTFSRNNEIITFNNEVQVLNVP